MKRWRFARLRRVRQAKSRMWAFVAEGLTNTRACSRRAGVAKVPGEGAPKHQRTWFFRQTLPPRRVTVRGDSSMIRSGMLRNVGVPALAPGALVSQTVPPRRRTWSRREVDILTMRDGGGTRGGVAAFWAAGTAAQGAGAGAVRRATWRSLGGEGGSVSSSSLPSYRHDSSGLEMA